MTEPMRQCPPCEVDRDLEPDCNAPRDARHAVRALGERALPESRRPDLDLLVTELVSNSLLHADAGLIGVRASARGEVVRVEVWDAGPGIGRRDVTMPEPAAHQGRGLPLVDRLADRWGSAVDRSRACVWFELGPDAPEERPAP